MNQNSIVTKKFGHSSTRCTSKTWRNNNWCSIKWHWMPLYTILPSRDFKHTECLPSVFSRISGINIITSNIQIMLVHCTVNLHVYRNIPICWSSVRIYTGTCLHQRDLAESSLSPNKWFLQRKYSYTVCVDYRMQEQKQYFLYPQTVNIHITIVDIHG